MDLECICGGESQGFVGGGHCIYCLEAGGMGWLDVGTSCLSIK